MQAFKLQHFAAAQPQDAFPSFTTITSEEIERLRGQVHPQSDALQQMHNHAAAGRD